MGVNINGSYQDNPYDATGVLDDARKVMPQVSSGTQRFFVRNPYGTDSMFMDLYSGLDVGLQNSGVVNPLLRVQNEHNTVLSHEYRIVGSVYGEVNFARFFTFRSSFYGDMSTLNRRTYTPLYYAYNPKTGLPEEYSSVTKVQEASSDWRKWQQDHILTYKNNFGEHALTATAGFTTYYYGNFNRNQNASEGDRPIPNDKRFWYVTTGFENPGTVSGNSSQNEYSTVSFLGRVLYNYQNKYFLNASFRDDASSRIPEKNRHQQFWAVGAAWDLARESFMDDQRVFNALKLKGSVGVLGNQTASYLDGTPLNYPSYPQIITGSGSSAVFGTNTFNAARREYIPNPDLKWETVFAQEVGIEGAALDNKLNFELNFFSRTTRDLMTFVDRSQVGLENMLVNGGKIRNKGIELSAGYTYNINSDLTLNVSGNITFLDNEVLELSENLPTGVLIRGFMNNGSAEARTMAGFPIATFWGYVVEGIYQTNADIEKSPDATAIGAYLPGDFKFKDVNGDGKITPDDRTAIGNPTPDFTYGGSINLTWKGWNLGVDVNGVYGNEIFRTWGSLESPFQRVNYSGDKVDRWHGPGTSNWVPIISQQRRFNYNGSTYNIEDGSYFRIRNLQLGYNFPQSMISGARIKNLRLFVNVQNLKTFKNNYGYTAEYGGQATAFGFDNAGGALPRVTTFGLNVTF